MDKKYIAYHEAGHAVLQERFHLYNGGASIVKDDNSLGRAMKLYEDIDMCCIDPETKEEVVKIDLESIRKNMMVSYAGRAAETILNPKRKPTGWGRDYENAKELNELAGNVFNQRKLIFETRKMLKENWKQVEAIANELLAHNELSDDEAELIVDAIDEGKDYKVVLENHRNFMNALRNDTERKTEDA